MKKEQIFCRLCGEQTKSICNINFKAVPVCDNCSNAIFIQQAVWFSNHNQTLLNHLKSKKVKDGNH